MAVHRPNYLPPLCVDISTAGHGTPHSPLRQQIGKTKALLDDCADGIPDALLTLAAAVAGSDAVDAQSHADALADIAVAVWGDSLAIAAVKTQQDLRARWNKSHDAALAAFKEAATDAWNWCRSWDPICDPGKFHHALSGKTRNRKPPLQSRDEYASLLASFKDRNGADANQVGWEDLAERLHFQMEYCKLSHEATSNIPFLFRRQGRVRHGLRYASARLMLRRHGVLSALDNAGKTLRQFSNIPEVPLSPLSIVQALSALHVIERAHCTNAS